LVNFDAIKRCSEPCRGERYGYFETDRAAEDTIEIKEQKTGKGRRITLNKICIKAIQNLLASKQYQNNDYFFQSQRRNVLTVPFNSKSRILQLSVIANSARNIIPKVINITLKSMF
jgi:hypothetical protein